MLSDELYQKEKETKKSLSDEVLKRFGLFREYKQILGVLNNFIQNEFLLPDYPWETPDLGLELERRRSFSALPAATGRSILFTLKFRFCR